MTHKLIVKRISTYFSASGGSSHPNYL